jgi:hypothetical protein
MKVIPDEKYNNLNAAKYKFVWPTGLPDSSWYIQHSKTGENLPKYHKIYKITSKYTKLPQNIQNNPKNN